MTENEAKDWLRAITATQSENNHTCSLEIRKEALYMAIQALEKQIAKKPYLDQKGLLDAKMWHCPVCKKEVISDWNIDLANEYCHNCGQKLDWSE